MNVIGKNLKKYREATGLSQQELANRIAVTRQTISNWERGVSLPDIDTVLLLAKEFHVEAVDILYANRPIDEFQASKPKRIKITLILGILFLTALLLSIFLLPYLHSLLYLFIVLPYSVTAFTLLPITYALGTAFAASLTAIWIDFRINSKKIRLSMLILSISFVVLYFVFMYLTTFGQFIGLSLNDLIHSDPVYNWFFFHPVIFIFPGAMLFCGFNKKPPKKAPVKASQVG